MMNQLLHTPEGVRDIYGEECARKAAVQRRIKDIFHLYGYRDIETPTFEFFDIFNKDRGTVDDKEMFKFFDRDNRTLVLRPDITPSIARCVAKYFMEEDMTVKLCYLERTFTNNSSYQGRLKELTQTGAEFIGDDSADADAEMLAMVIDSLKAAGLHEFQVELGQVEFFRGLLEEAGMDEAAEEELRELIENKNYFGVEELVMEQPMAEHLKQVFLKLPELFGSLDQIRAARALTNNPRALAAIDRLEKIQRILDSYGLSEYVSYDLGMLNKYKYYTGLIFKAYTYGTGEYIMTGGRYDKLLVQFGKDTPAVGFVILVDQLMMALSRQKLNIPVDMGNTMILYEETARENAIRLAKHFRRLNMKVQMSLRASERTFADYLDYAGRSGLRNVLYMEGDGSLIRVTDVVNGTTDTIPVTEYIKEA